MFLIRCLSQTAIIVGALASVCASRMEGAIIVSNLGESQINGILVRNTGSDFPVSPANSFTTGADPSLINSITIRASELSSSPPNSFAIQIRDDNGGTVGSTVLGTFDVASGPYINNAPGSFDDYVFPVSGPVMLSANTTYWLAFLAAPGADYGLAITNSENQTSNSGWTIGDQVFVSLTDPPTAWSPNDGISVQFALDATAIPEPGSMTLCSLVAIGAGWKSWRSPRKQATAIIG